MHITVPIRRRNTRCVGDESASHHPAERERTPQNNERVDQHLKMDDQEQIDEHYGQSDSREQPE